MLFEQYQILYFLWHEFLNTDEKQISSYHLFSRKVKSKLLDTEDEVRYFEISYFYYFKLIWIFEYTRMQYLWDALVEGCFWELCGGFVGERPRWSVTKAARRFCWGHTSAWLFSCGFVAYFSGCLFMRAPLEGYFCIRNTSA